MSEVVADGTGSGTFPGMAAGTYYLMISAKVNNRNMVWTIAVKLKAGANLVTLDLNNATPINLADSRGGFFRSEGAGR